MAIIDWSTVVDTAPTGHTDIGTKLYAAELTAGSIPAKGFKWVLPITSAPAGGAEPETVQTTTMDRAKHTYAIGRQDLASFQFGCNRTAEIIAQLKALKAAGAMAWLVVYGDGTGQLFKGESDFFTNELALGDVSAMTLTVVGEVLGDKDVSEVSAYLAP